MRGGALVISLDFELHWGVRDIFTVDAYRENLIGVREAVPALLDLFAARGIHATWATVGFLFCRSKKEIEETLPTRLPRYANTALSPYDLGAIGNDESSDPFHYAPSLIERIARTAGQEVGTHTFSHFYCLERGQTDDDFDADMHSATNAARRLGIQLHSIVFPRNQENMSYHRVLVRHGMRAFRSSGPWPHNASVAFESSVKRIARLADAYLPLSGGGTHLVTRDRVSGIVGVPASAFLRPYNSRLARLERLKIGRLKRAMSHAAAQSQIFHIWWHPHNFGTNLRANMTELEAILDHFGRLRADFGMQSMSMVEAAAGG